MQDVTFLLFIVCKIFLSHLALCNRIYARRIKGITKLYRKNCCVLFGRSLSKSRLELRPLWIRSFVVFSFPPDKCRDVTTQWAMTLCFHVLTVHRSSHKLTDETGYWKHHYINQLVGTSKLLLHPDNTLHIWNLKHHLQESSVFSDIWPLTLKYEKDMLSRNVGAYPTYPA